MGDGPGSMRTQSAVVRTQDDSLTPRRRPLLIDGVSPGRSPEKKRLHDHLQPCPLTHSPVHGRTQAKLHTIKSLNDAYSGKQLKFFSLEDSADASMDVPPLCSTLLEAIVQMHSAPILVEELSELKVGTSIIP